MNVHFSWILSHIDLISINKKISFEDYLLKTILPIALMYDDRKNKRLENKRSRNLYTHSFMNKHIYTHYSTIYMYTCASMHKTYFPIDSKNSERKREWESEGEREIERETVIVGRSHLYLCTHSTFLYNTKHHWRYDLLLRRQSIWLKIHQVPLASRNLNVPGEPL